MYCPNCGQQQISEEMRFCSRCGLALSGLAEWLAGGRFPLKAEDDVKTKALSPRRKGMRRAAKLMFFSGVLFPIFMVFSIVAQEGGPMAIPFIVFFISAAMMLYARLFSDPNPRENKKAIAQTAALGSVAARGSLPPATPTNIPAAGRGHVRTNELAQPPSVTEQTTRLLDNE